MERVYLGDWLYNAGIIGFLKINHHLWKIEREKLISQDESLLKFGDNYLEFDRKIFERFVERFFESIVNRYKYIYPSTKISEEDYEKIVNKFLKIKSKNSGKYKGIFFHENFSDVFSIDKFKQNIEVPLKKK